MALKELLQRPQYQGLGKYDVEPAECQLFKAMVPNMTADQLRNELVDIVAQRSITGALVYSVQVLQPYNLKRLLSDLDLNDVRQPFADEVRSGMLGTDFFYNTPESVLVRVLQAVLDKANLVAISLRANSTDALRHKQVSVDHIR